MNKLYKYFTILTILFLPLYYIKIILNDSIRLNLVDILSITAIITWFITPSCRKQYLKVYYFLKSEALLTTGLILLGISLILSTVFSIDPLKSLGGLKSWFLLPILFFLINRFAINHIAKYKIVGISSAIVALISLIYFLSQNLTYDGRLKGFWEHPNYLAMFLGPSIFVFLFIKLNNNLRIIIISLISFVVLATKSYNVWLAIIISFLLYLILFQKTKISYWLILIFLSLTLFISQITTPKFHNLFSQNQSSIKERLTIYRAATRIIKDNLITGVGLNNFQKAYLDYQKYFEPYPNWAVPMPHNFILAILVQMGILGLVGFMIIIIWAYKTLIAQKKDQIAFMSLTFYLALGLLDTPFFKTDLAFLFWLTVL